MENREKSGKIETFTLDGIDTVYLLIECKSRDRDDRFGLNIYVN